MHEVTEFYDLTNAAVLGWNAAVKRCCDRQPTSHPENLTAETICALTGLLPLYPFNVPEGMVAVGAPWTVWNGLEAVEACETITQAEYDAAELARITQADAEAAQRQQTRIAELAQSYGADIAIIGRLLDVFGLSYPCEVADATTLIKGGLATGQIALDMAPYADTLEARYKAVREAMTDAEIVHVAQVLGSQQGQ
jgi:hypothetical protein